jgi:AmmeMemoRadiSam system protein B
MNEFISNAQGIFYTSDPDLLHRQITEAVNRGNGSPVSLPAALLLPHASYEYTLPAAAEALGSLAEKPSRIIILSPLHSQVIEEDMPSSIFLPPFDSLKTPLGSLIIDHDDRDLFEHPPTAVQGCYFEEEVSWELPGPIIQTLWGSVPLFPIIFAGNRAQETTTLSRLLSDIIDDSTLVIISSNAASGKEGKEKAETFARLLSGEQKPSLLSETRYGRINSCGAGIVDALYRTGRARHPWRVTTQPFPSPNEYSWFSAASISLTRRTP